MYVACCQLDTAWEDKPANFAKVHSLLAAARLPAGALVLLPEMFATGFSMDVATVAENSDGPTHQFLARSSRDLGVCLLGGLVTRGTDGRGRNEAVAYSPAGVEVARYCKLHPFRFAGEADHYAPGEAVRLFDHNEFRVAPFVCYDLRFPEVFRAAVRSGTTLLAIIANWPASREQHWLTLLAARAIENQAYVVAVNRCGSDPKLAYMGRSVVIDPRGKVVVDAGAGEGVVGAEIDLAELQQYRADFPALQDMRLEYLGS